MGSLEDIIDDLIYVNKTTGIKTIKGFKESWFILFTGIIYTVLNLLVFSIIRTLLVGPLSILSGIAMAIISSSFISNYLYLLNNIINYNRITLQNFKDGFSYYLMKIYGVFFIAYIARLILSLASAALGSVAVLLNALLYIGVVIVLNPLPETIYLKAYDSNDSIFKTVEFVKENWFNWFVPNIIFLGLLYLVTGNLLTDVFNTHLYFNASIFSTKTILFYLIGQSLFSIMMIYRGHLYKLLSSGSRRKRMFMNKF